MKQRTTFYTSGMVGLHFYSDVAHSDSLKLNPVLILYENQIYFGFIK